MAASFSMPGEGEPMIPVVFPARSTGIGIANRQARRRRARTGAQIFPASRVEEEPHDRAVDEAAALGGPCALEAAARSIRRCVQVARVAASGP